MVQILPQIVNRTIHLFKKVTDDTQTSQPQKQKTKQQIIKQFKALYLVSEHHLKQSGIVVTSYKIVLKTE